MNPSHKLFWLIGGVAALLVVASVIGRILRARVKDEKAAAVVDNLNARVRAWWSMVAVFAAAFLLGRNATIAMFALISFFALREFLTLTPTKIGDHRALSVAFFVLIPVQYLLIATNWYGLFSIFIPVYGFLFLPSISVLAHDTENFLERSARIQWGLMITVYCISHVPALLLLEIPGYIGETPLLMFYLILVVQMSDVLQYVFGKLFGKTKIAPVVSPSKTVRLCRRSGERHADRRRDVVDHTLHAPSVCWHGIGYRADGLPRRPRALGGQTKSRGQRLGLDDRGTWRRDGPDGFGQLRSTDILSCDPLFFYVRPGRRLRKGRT
jgi:phosphatidate cytidylyltransferase